MTPLLDSAMLADVIVGCVSETLETQHQAALHRQDILAQAKKNASFDSISKSILSRLKAENVRLNKFNVEDVYEHSPDSNDNINVWINASKLNDETRAKIKTVSVTDILQATRFKLTGLKITGSRLKPEYRAAGVKQPQASLKETSVTLDQVRSSLGSSRCTRLILLCYL